MTKRAMQPEKSNKMHKEECEVENKESNSSSESYWTSSEDGSQSDVEESELKEEQENEEIQVEFEFNDFKEIDYHGLKSLLKQVFTLDDIQYLNDNELADLIIKKNIGCTVKVDDNLDPFAVITCLSTTETDSTICGTSNESTTSKCVEKVFEFLREKCSSASITINAPVPETAASNKVDYFINMLKSPTTAWLINDRLINMPPQIVPNMFSFLLDDLKESNSNISHFLYISKTYNKVSPVSKKSKSNSKKRKTMVEETSCLEYFQVEDEFIHNHALAYFDYDLPKQQVSDSRRVFDEMGVQHARRVYLLDLKSVEGVLLDELREKLV